MKANHRPPFPWLLLRFWANTPALVRLCAALWIGLIFGIGVYPFVFSQSSEKAFYNALVFCTVSAGVVFIGVIAFLCHKNYGRLLVLIFWPLLLLFVQLFRSPGEPDLAWEGFFFIGIYALASFLCSRFLRNLPRMRSGLRGFRGKRSSWRR